jgi:CelD/BcsL family acetyltransferase involved in cellulose biosynthesis
MAQLSPALLETPIDAKSDFRAVSDRAGAEPVNSARTEIRLSVYEDLDSIEHEWRAFERHADGTVFQSYEWLSTWQRHIGARRGVRPAIVIGRDARGMILLLLPLSVERGLLFRRLTWLGHELSDYNAPLLARDFSQHVDIALFRRLWDEAWMRLRSHPRLAFDVACFERMPEALGTQHNPMLQLGATPHCDSAYIVSLEDSWEKLYSKRSSATRRHDRSKRQKLADHGEIRFVSAVEPAEVVRTIETLMAQKSRWFSDMGVDNIFAKPGVREFFIEVASNAETRSITHVSRLDVGSSTAATSFGLIRGDCYYHVLASYDRSSSLARFGPGAAHLHDLMRFAIGRKFRKFDFSVGNERFKYEWCDSEMKLYDQVAAATLRGACGAIPILFMRELKRRIKQNPKLWNVFRRSRVLVGSLKPLIRPHAVAR